MKRPDDLPDFGKPPLDEVVLGIQFSPPANYQQIRAGEVWSLFKDRFPIVEEYPPLVPAFETFGRPGPPHINFGIVGATHDRFWFVSPEGDQLIQFQNDRLLHNWRKRSKPEIAYPRYEAIVEQFEREVSQLEEFFLSLGSSLVINQCEISYINHLTHADQKDEPLVPTDWLRFAEPLANTFDDFHFQFRRQINNEAGGAAGRITCDAGNAVRLDGCAIIALNITARGAPQAPTLQSALEFIGKGREMIVRLFAEVTTDSAHDLWERKQ